MNWGIPPKARRAGLPRLDISLDNVRTAAVPAMAIGGLIGIVGVFVSLQCGGLDRCIAGPTTEIAAVDIVDAVAEQPAEPRLLPDNAAEPVVAATPVDPALAPAAEVAALAQPAAATKAQDVIGDTFSAIDSDDQGWLSGRLAAPGADAPVQPAAAPRKVVTRPQLPPAVIANVEGLPAVAAVAAATREAEVTPLDRPRPLTMNAFVEERAPTDAKAQVAAKKQLVEVSGDTTSAAGTKVATALAVEPTAKAAPATKAAKVADISADTRTVAGSGVTVRSGPGKSYGRKFALAAGEKVKVSDSQKGWLKITDDQGRTGWAYKAYLD